jgi:surface polysaccharide O-acyltransferase-like enzyme
MMTALLHRISKAIRYAMPVFYLTIGLLLTFSQSIGAEAGRYRIILGILLIGYSVFRTWRIFKDPVNKEENEVSED